MCGVRLVLRVQHGSVMVNPTMDWRVFLAAADLNQYVPVLEKRGVRSHYELGLITDEEYSKLTSSGMAVHEISALRKVLLNSDHAALRQVPQLASKKAVDRAGDLSSNTNKRHHLFQF